MLANHLNFLLSSWKEGFKILFVPKNALLFMQGILVILHSFFRKYTTLVKPWKKRIGIAVFTVAPLSFLLVYYLDNEHLVILVTRMWLYGTIGLGLIFFSFYKGLAFLLMRPSLMPKNRSYFKAHKQHLLYFVILDCLTYGLVATSFLYPSQEYVRTFISGLFLLIVPFLVIHPLFLFFWFDTPLSFRNTFYCILRAGSMFYYNAPLVLLVTLFQASFILGLALLLSYKYEMLMPVLLIGGLTSLTMVIIPFFIACWAVIYIKKVNEQRVLYFS